MTAIQNKIKDVLNFNYLSSILASVLTLASGNLVSKILYNDSNYLVKSMFYYAYEFWNLNTRNICRFTARFYKSMLAENFEYSLTFNNIQQEAKCNKRAEIMRK